MYNDKVLLLGTKFHLPTIRAVIRNIYVHNISPLHSISCAFNGQSLTSNVLYFYKNEHNTVSEKHISTVVI